MSKGIRVLGLPLGTSSFMLSFIKDVLIKDVHHVDLFPRLGDIQVGLGIIIYCFLQELLYLLCCTMSSTFIESLVSFDFSFLQVFGHLLCLGFFDSLEIPLACKYVFFLITLGGIELISTTTIVAKLIRELGPCNFNHSC